MTGADPNTERLTALLAQGPSLADGDLRARLQWIEDAAGAAEALELDDDGKQGALHLRAALGAFVRFSQLPEDERATPRAQLELDLLVRTLLARGVLGLYRALAASYDALVRARAPHRAACAELRDAFREAAAAVERGEAVSVQTRERIGRASASLTPPS